MINKLFNLCITLLLCNFLYAQDNHFFYAKIPNDKYIPEISHTYQGEKVNLTRTGDEDLDRIINSYEIYDVRSIFINANNPSLNSFYIIECNDINLMNDLKNFNKYYIKLIEELRETLVLPDDFGTTGGYTAVDQEELNYIRAQEAWSVTEGKSDVIIGIVDNNVQPLHEDLINKVTIVGPNYPNAYTGSSQHGSYVSSVAAADTDNSKGLSAIGFESFLYTMNGRTAGVDEMSQISGVKVINTSWIAPNDEDLQNVYNQVVEDRGVVVVGSAGNGAHRHGSFDSYIYPAAYKNVISVSGIGHQNEVYGNHEVFLDYHEFKWGFWEETQGEEWYSFQHNDSVDLVAPAVGISRIRPSEANIDGYYNNDRGTSYASPIVSGTIALMFDVNYCLDPKEVETILKLTAVKIDHLPQNLPFYGQLGAGKLDAYEAVKMSKDMADSFGTVEVKNRILYRPWFYKLTTAPYEIKLSDNDVSGGSKLKFRARNNIEIISGTYMPDTGYIDLQIDENLDLNWCPARPSSVSPQVNNNSNGKSVEEEEQYVVFPTLVKNQFTIKPKNVIHQSVDIKVFDFFGVEVFSKTKVLINEDYVVSFNKFRSGIYVLKIYDNGDEVHTEKLVKK